MTLYQMICLAFITETVCSSLVNVPSIFRENFDVTTPLHSSTVIPRKKVTHISSDTVVVVYF